MFLPTADFPLFHIVADPQGNVSYHMPALHALFYLPEAKAGDFPRGFNISCSFRYPS
jgi:hypothetical protein